MSHPIDKKKLAAGAAMVALSSFVPNPIFTDEAHAQATASAVLTIQASVTNPLGITPGPNLNFGTFATAGAGSVSIDAAGVTAIVNGFVVTAAVNGTVKLTAPKSATFSLSITDYKTGTIFIDNGGGGLGATPTKTMTVKRLYFIDQGTNFNTKLAASQTVKNASANITGISIDNAAGTGKADIGGLLLFSGNQITGAYSGTYTMVISF